MYKLAKATATNRRFPSGISWIPMPVGGDFLLRTGCPMERGGKSDPQSLRRRATRAESCIAEIPTGPRGKKL